MEKMRGKMKIEEGERERERERIKKEENKYM